MELIFRTRYIYLTQTDLSENVYQISYFTVHKHEIYTF